LVATAYFFIHLSLSLDAILKASLSKQRKVRTVIAEPEGLIVQALRYAMGHDHIQPDVVAARV
jgi:hypothetical protein